MHHAKARGKARYELFNTSMNKSGHDRLGLELDLRHAISHGDFTLHYQPVLAFDSGRIAEVEALVRWNHPQRGLLLPADFVGLTEETGLIVPLGRWITTEACRQLRQWQTAGEGAPLVMSVNLSARQLQHPHLVDDVAAALEETQIDPGTLRFEITETVVMQDAPSTLAKLEALKRLGVHLAIDDFGTGYSSLGYLKRFPVDTLKIDRSFVNGIGRDAEDTAVVRAMITVAKSLGLAVTAEGIETETQLGELRALGCDRGQGYLFARPVPADRIPPLLAAAPWARAKAKQPPAFGNGSATIH
jgi:EAL domain-containing protein (putative c-di-GMP-specific phosphodiesterase class I)